MSALPSFSPEQLLALKKGDSFTTEGVLLGVSGEPVVWTVLEVDDHDPDAWEAIVEMFYFRVLMGKFAVQVWDRQEVTIEEL